MGKYRWLFEFQSIFARRWVLALLAADAGLIGLHIYLGATVAKIPLILNIASDRSLAEFLGYAELGLASILLWIVFVKTREPLMRAFAIILFVMMLDDSAGLHEKLGSFFVASMGLAGDAVLDGKDEGEMVIWLLYATVLLPLLLFGLFRTPLDRWFRAFGLLLVTAALAGFAVVVDGLHSSICQIGGGFPYCFQLLDLIEDGGEKITQSLILAHVIYLARNTAAPALFDFTQHMLPLRLSARLR